MWPSFSLVFFFFIILLYVIQILGYSLAKEQASDSISRDKQASLFLSVVIPFRNEKAHLANLLSDLVNQNYPQEYYEVLFVDDHSSDGSADLLKDLIKELNNVSLISLDEAEGKKAAIDAGVSKARGTWLIQTDADCRLGSNFISEYASKASAGAHCLLAGPVSYMETDRLWGKIETLEFLSLTGSGMYAFQLGKPVMCNAANLAYSKAFYLEVRDRLLSIDSPSGDDVFLLLEAKKKKKGPGYLYSENAIVKTYDTGSPAKFLAQRLRWGSKSKFYRDKDIIYLALIVFFSNASLTALFVMSLFQAEYWYFFAGFWLMKLVPDLILMDRTLRFFRRRSLLSLFPLTALFYYFYISIAGPLSMLTGFSWKGRSFDAE